MRPIPWIIVFALLLAACSGSDPARQVESAQSWTATSIFLGERWLNHSVPDGYSIDALTNAGAELSKIADGLEQSMADSSPPKLSSIIRPIRSGAARAHQMAVEVQQKNAPASRFYQLYEIPWNELDLSDPETPLAKVLKKDILRAR